MIEIYQQVALLEDIPEENLYRGQVGTVIEVWEPGTFEVAFTDPTTGIDYAQCVLKAEQLMRLYFEPIEKAN